MINERNKYIDFIKGIAVFLVLWGHVIQYCFYSGGGGGRI